MWINFRHTPPRKDQDTARGLVELRVVVDHAPGGAQYGIADQGLASIMARPYLVLWNVVAALTVTTLDAGN